MIPRAIADKVIVEQCGKDNITESGLHLVTDEEPENVGIVISVGNGKMVNGMRILPEVFVGDKIHFGGGFTKIKVEGKEYLVMLESNILCVL